LLAGKILISHFKELFINNFKKLDAFAVLEQVLSKNCLIIITSLSLFILKKAANGS